MEIVIIVGGGVEVSNDSYLSWDGDIFFLLELSFSRKRKGVLFFFEMIIKVRSRVLLVMV